MEFLTEHLLQLRLTSIGAMNADSERQHDNFARQLSAFEKLLVITHSYHDAEQLYTRLKLVLKDGAKNKGMLKLSTLGSLRECIKLYAETHPNEKEVEEMEKYFDGYFETLTHLERMRQFYHETLYKCLYHYYYEPIDETDRDPEQSSRKPTPDFLFSDDDLSDDDEGDKSDQPSPNPTPSPEPSTVSPNLEDSNNISVQQDKSPSVSPLLLSPPKVKKKKLKKRRDETKSAKKRRKRARREKVLEKILREKAERDAQLANQKFDETTPTKETDQLKYKSDRQRLSYTVKKIFDIHRAWRALTTEGQVLSKHFGEESLSQVKDFKNYLPFEPLFRLIPDLICKGFRLVELSKIWYNSAKRLYGPEPALYQSVDAFLDKIAFQERTIKNIDTDIAYKLETKKTKTAEWKMLVNKVTRFNKVKERHAECVEHEKELKSYYKSLKAERNAEYPKMERFQRDDPGYKQSYDHIQYLAEQMSRVYRELQTASYELEMVKQDYSLELEARPNLIRLQDDVKFSIQDIHLSIPLDEEHRKQCAENCELIRENVDRMWQALYDGLMSKKQTQKAESVLKRKLSQMEINNPVEVDLTDEMVNMDGTDEIEQELERDIEKSLDNSTNGTPEPPSPAPTKKRLRGFNPSAAGITDSTEADQYRKRVERLKKDFTLDLSELKTKLDCIVTPRPQSGNEADEDSDGENKRPQSKRMTKRAPSADRNHSPLSDSSEYVYGANRKPQGPPRTVYILKKSVGRQRENTNKSSPDERSGPEHRQKTLYKQQVPSKSRPTPMQRSWVDTQTGDRAMIDTLSIYKRSPVLGQRRGQLRPLAHEEGVFTPNIDLNDDDISTDSGTGESLDSKSDVDSNSKREDGYKHQPRLTVREQLAASKIPRSREDSKPTVFHARSVPKYPPPILNSRLPVPKQRPGKALRPLPDLVDHAIEAVPVMAKAPTKPKPRQPVRQSPQKVPEPIRPLGPPSPEQLNRNTLLMSKPMNSMRKTVRHALQTDNAKPGKKPVTRAKVAQKPAGSKPIAPHASLRRHGSDPTHHRRGGRVRIIETNSDNDDDDEVFQRKSFTHPLPPKPSVRAALAPPKPRRRPGMPRAAMAF